MFLANIDDDDKSCSTNGTDAQLAACNDASNTTIDGTADLEDLARIKTVPWPSAPVNASGLLAVDTNSNSKVRLFKKSGANFSVFNPGTVLTSAELQAGVEFAIEAKDIVRDDAVWNGLTTLTLTVNPGGGQVVTDKVQLRVAPVLFRHHLDAPDVIYATTMNDGDSLAFRNDLTAAMTAAGVAKPLSLISDSDQWTQDFFETAYMSMPAVGGQKIIHVNFRSANYTSGKFRAAGKVVFTVLRGQDVAGTIQYDPNHDDNMDSLNSFGNLETITRYVSRPASTWANVLFPEPLGPMIACSSPVSTCRSSPQRISLPSTDTRRSLIRSISPPPSAQPIAPSRLTPRSFRASTANSIGNSWKTSLQKPWTIMATASSVLIPRCAQ